MNGASVLTAFPTSRLSERNVPSPIAGIAPAPLGSWNADIGVAKEREREN